MYSLMVLGAASFIVSLLVTPLVRNLFRRWGVVDHPGDRKLHTSAVPRVGGVAIALAYVAAYGVLVLVGLQGGDIIWSARLSVGRLLPAASVIFAIGLVDDLIGLKPWYKFAGQVVAAGLAYSAGIHVRAFGGLEIGPWWSISATIFWLLLCTNAMNLIDGVDGLAAGLGLFATATTFIAALLQNNIELALATVPLAGALLGFLRFNFNPATIFLGDCGSLLIGFLLGCYGILWSQKSATLLGMVAPLMAFAIPLLDTGLAIARRFLRRQPIFGADRGHIHHRLLDRGFTHRGVVLSLYGFCALGALCSIAITNRNVEGLVLVAFCLLVWIGIWQLGYVEFGLAARMFLDGAFRRQLNARIALNGFEQKLIAADTPDDWWPVIRNASRDFGFHHVEMSISGRTFSHRNGAPTGTCWNISIPISDNDYVGVTRVFGENSHAAVVGPFADIIKRTLAPKLATASSLAALYRVQRSEPDAPGPRVSCIFLNQFFWPDSAATSQLLTDMVTHVLRESYVGARVICAANRYAGEESAPPQSLAIDRCPATPFVRGMLGRLVSYGSFLASAAFYGFRGARPDVVVTLTTPPGLALVGTLLHYFRGARHYIWEMDLYPDIAVDVKMLSSSSPLTRILAWGLDFPRRHADGVIALGEEMKDRLVAHGIAPEKIQVCDNWADGKEIVPRPFPQGPLTVCYSGNFGLAHEVDTIREAVVHLRNDPRFCFVFAGGGKHRAALEGLCRDSAIDNVSFEPYSSREHLGRSLSRGHLGLVTQLPETLGSIVPSKTYGIMAAGRPVLYIGPRQATPARIIEAFDCGWQIEPGDVTGLVRLLERLERRRDLIVKAGARARVAFDQNYDRPIGVARICAVLGVKVPATQTFPADAAASVSAPT